MFVLAIEHANDATRGKLRRYLYKIKPGVYVGTTSAKNRDLIWGKFIEPDQSISATLIYPEQNEQGFSSRMQGTPSREIKEIEGVLYMQKHPTLSVKDFSAKLGTRKDLLCHMYETAILARELMTHGCLRHIVERIAYLADEKIEDVINILTFLCAVHDIGKFHPDFQIGILGKDVLIKFGYTKEPKTCRHEQYGASVLEKWLIDHDYDEDIAKLLSQCIYIHHQDHKPNDYENLDDDITIQKIIDDTLSSLSNTFPFKQDVFQSIVGKAGTNGIFMFVAVIINCTDWAASSGGTFDEKTYSDFDTLDDYLNHLKKQASDFVAGNSLSDVNIRVMFKHFEDTFEEIFGITSKRPLQNKILKISRELDQTPRLLIIEDSCGSGKTESALHFVAKQSPGGFYMALPTTATSETMRDRVQRFIDASGDGQKIPAFTGTAWLSEKDISIDQESWLRPSRQKMFYPYAVGTIDQLIASVQKAKYGLLRLLAISNKTLVIDEMHAYDAYMLSNIKELLRFCGWLGVSVVILSATLPKNTKAELIKGYVDEEKKVDKVVFSKAYPLITEVKYDAKKHRSKTAFQVTQYECDPAFIKNYNFDLVKAIGKNQNEKIIELAKERINNGGCLAIVLNSVRSVQILYEKMIQGPDLQDCLIMKIHARHTIEKKDELIAKLNDRFGKNREHRPEKAIVIATPMIEQSLDVDFDYMFTEIAPIDLLIQRFGRYRRHDDKGTIREQGLNDDRIVVFIPEEGGVFGSSGLIYDEPILRDTITALSSLEDDCLKTPDNVRGVIDFVYSEKTPSSFKKNDEMNKASQQTIKSPYENAFEYFRFCYRNDFLPIQTRLASYNTYDIAIVSEKDEKELTGAHVPIDVAKRIMRRNVITNVPEWLIIKDEFHAMNIKEGYLEGVDIYVCGDDGFVEGEEGSFMGIVEGEFVCG